jgi:hypothetical protein
VSHILTFQVEKVAIFKAKLTSLQVEKKMLSTSIEEQSSILEVATKHHVAFKSYSTCNSDGALISSTLEPIPHPLTWATKPFALGAFSPCLACSTMFPCYDIVVASCKCMYHLWCMGFHLQIFGHCAKVSCNLLFHLEWIRSMGFKVAKGDEVITLE